MGLSRGVLPGLRWMSPEVSKMIFRHSYQVLTTKRGGTREDGHSTRASFVSHQRNKRNAGRSPGASTASLHEPVVQSTPVSHITLSTSGREAESRMAGQRRVQWLERLTLPTSRGMARIYGPLANRHHKTCRSTIDRFIVPPLRANPPPKRIAGPRRVRPHKSRESRGEKP